MKIVHGWAFPEDDQFMSAKMHADGSYQRTHLETAIKYVRHRRVAIDGGAHIGTWSRVMSQCFEKVIAFEPTPSNHECLVRNMRHFDAYNVIIENKALGAKRGKITMTLEGHDRAIALKNSGAMFVKQGGEIDQIPLDEYDLHVLDLFKLDVEGSEVDAFLGARKTLMATRPIILFEEKGLWKRYGYSRNEPQRILKSMGAQKIERVKCDEIWGWPL